MKNRNLFPLERNRYYHGKMLTARDFETEQNYYNNKRRLINRCVLGAGVICGLGVYRNDDTSLSIETGLALDYDGREIAVTSPIIRKLQMIEGFETLVGHEQAYLCLEYDELLREPINNIGAADSESQQFNKIEESFRLYLDPAEPDIRTLFGEGGRNNVQTLYQGQGVSIYEVVPAVALAGQEFTVKYVVLKGAGLPPLSFSYTYESDTIRREEGSTIQILFNEDKNSDQEIYRVEYTLKAVAISDMQVPFGKGKGTLTLGMGDLRDQLELPLKHEIYLAGSPAKYEQMVEVHLSNLERQLSGGDTPIYLARIDYISAGSTHVLRKVNPLPFGQRITGIGGGQEGKASGNPSWQELLQNVTTDVEILKYWQKPEVKVRYSAPKKALNFHFGVPSSEAYDYATSSGIVEIPLGGAIRVNARFTSDEVPHNLGLGHVSLNFAVEFGGSESRKLLFGNGEVFKNKEIPKVEVAGILYPENGTFRIGIRCLDHVEGHLLKIRWFAYKVTRDTAELRAKDVVNIKITPDIHKMKVLERMHFAATVGGTADKGISWSVKDADGGKIDQSGLYQAPSIPGTFEIVAASAADPEIKTSAFVIVEE